MLVNIYLQNNIWWSLSFYPENALPYREWGVRSSVDPSFPSGKVLTIPNYS
jgi:hypothetical protein